MGFLPGPVAIATMRRTVEMSFDQAILLRRVTLTPDNEGGQVETVSEVGYRGRVVPQRVVPAERVQGGRLAAQEVWQVRLPWDADVEPTDTLVLEDGTELLVTDEDDIKSTKLQVVVDCYRVT